MTRKQKVKYLISLIAVLCIVGGVYIFANQMHFLPIMWIYSIIAGVGACIYIYLYMKNKAILAQQENSDGIDQVAAKKRSKLIKLVTIIFLPFVIVLLCDYTYVLLLADSDLFKSFSNLF